MSPAEELRSAAKTLREAAKGTSSTEGGWGGSVDEEHGTAFIFGGPLDSAGYRTGVVFEFKDELDCENCARPSFADVGWWITATPALAEPLAAWLEGQATRHDEIDCVWCGPDDVPNPIGPCGEMADALRVARAIAGSAS